VEHDDANRLQMGSKMQGQALPCLWPERPVVGTGMESYISACSRWNQKAELGGHVLQADSRAVTVISSTVAEAPGHLQPIEKQVVSNTEEEVVLPDLPGGWEQSDLHLRSEMATQWPIDIQGTQKKAGHHHSTVVSPGETVSLGDTLAEGNCMNGGELAIGKNLVIAYLPFDGYNYEDAIVISARLVREHVLTSVHYKDLTYVLHEDQTLSRQPGDPSYFDEGVAKEGTWVEAGDILAIMQNENVDDAPWRPAREPWKVPDGIRGRIVSKNAQYVRCKDNRTGVRALRYELTVKIAMMKEIEVGDKMSGRHGNKGIVAKILDDRDMPYLPDGTPLDIILNPLGVPSRMNVGQIFECLLGAAGRWTNQEYRIGSFDEMFAEDASRGVVFEALRRARDQTGYEWLLDPRSPGKTRMYDGRTGAPLDQPVTAGVSYILKLNHMVTDKIFARSTGKYSNLTQQPLHGGKVTGGQRVGEMEVSALVGYGAHRNLQEMMTVKSDDMLGRDMAKQAMMTGRPVEVPEGGTSEGYLLFQRELAASGFLVHGGSDDKHTSSSKREHAE